MSDLISRGKLFNLLAPVQTLGEAYGIIQKMPTVDAVPVEWILEEAKKRLGSMLDEQDSRELLSQLEKQL